MQGEFENIQFELKLMKNGDDFSIQWTIKDLLKTSTISTGFKTNRSELQQLLDQFKNMSSGYEINFLFKHSKFHFGWLQVYDQYHFGFSTFCDNSKYLMSAKIKVSKINAIVFYNDYIVPMFQNLEQMLTI